MSAPPAKRQLLPLPDPANVVSTSHDGAASKENRCRSRPKRSTTRRHDPLTNSVHPYQEVMARKMYKLKVLCNQLANTAASDLVLANNKSGVSNFHPNFELAKQMDMASKELATLSKEMHLKAEEIRRNAEAERDKKSLKQGIVFMTEVTDPREEVQLVQDRTPQRMKYTQEMKPTVPPRLTVSDDKDMPIPTNNDPDTRFMHVKRNLNNPNKVQFKCDSCGKVFRDSAELNNHLSVHQYDMFRCIKCRKVCRSFFSFEKHMQTHYGTEIRCKVCKKRFDLKSSLINHMQMHSEDRIRCDKCDKTFKYRQNASEHIQYAHLDRKTVPCPVCSKMYQTPTNMRSHRARRHGLVEDIVYHENSETDTA